MKRTATLLTLCLLVAGAAAASTATREFTERFDWKPTQQVAIELGVGEMRIEAGSGDKVEITIVARCRWESQKECGDALDEIEIDESSTDSRLRLDIEANAGWRRMKLEMEVLVLVPKQADLHVEMGVGELEIDGPEGRLRVELGVGEAEVRYPRAKAGSVSVESGVGEASLRGAGAKIEGRRSFLVGSEVDWDEGEGPGVIDVEVGVGEASVWLE